MQIGTFKEIYPGEFACRNELTTAIFSYSLTQLLNKQKIPLTARKFGGGRATRLKSHSYPIDIRHISAANIKNLQLLITKNL